MAKKKDEQKQDRAQVQASSAATGQETEDRLTAEDEAQEVREGR